MADATTQPAENQTRIIKIAGGSSAGCVLTIKPHANISRDTNEDAKDKGAAQAPVQNSDAKDKEDSQDSDEDDYASLVDFPHPQDANCVCTKGDFDWIEGDFDDFYDVWHDPEEDDEVELREFFDGLWYHRGVPSDWFESVYLDGSKATKKAKTVYGWSVDYDRCTAKELKRFVLERSLRDPYPAGTTLKSYYIPILQKGDQEEQEFRFMDLPPEMRLMIYTELLTLQTNDRGKRSCTPGILGTCAQILKEANDILYNCNTIIAKLESGSCANGQHPTQITVHNVHMKTTNHYTKFSRLPKGIDDYPPFLRKITYLRIEVVVHNHATRGSESFHADVAPQNVLLYTLASFLMDGHQLKHLIVAIKAGDGGDKDYFAYKTLFYPLRRLRNIPKLTIEGYVPPAIPRRLAADFASLEPAINTLRHYELLYAEVDAQRRMYDATGMSGFCDECYDMSEECMNMENAADAVEEGVMYSCFNSKREENHLARLDFLKTTLEESNPAKKMQELMRARKIAHEATRAYEVTTDEGRLAEARNNWIHQTFEEDFTWYDHYGMDAQGGDHDWTDVEDDDTPGGAEVVAVSERQNLLTGEEIDAIIDGYEPEHPETPDDEMSVES